MNRICTGNENRLCGRSSCQICFKRSIASYPDIEKYWISEKNNVNIYTISMHSNKKYWFRCKICTHKVEKSPNKFLNRNGCNYCPGGGKIVCDDISCSICKPNRLSTYLHENAWISESNIKPPHMIRYKSNEIIHIRCRVCSHIYSPTAYNYINQNGCCYCSNGGSIVCSDLTCSICKPNRLSTYLHGNAWISELNIKPPHMVRYKSEEIIHIRCRICNHIYSPSAKSYINQEGCCYCKNNGGLVSLCDDNTCQQCFNNSFASNILSKYWNHSKNDKLPREVRKCSAEKYQFICPYCKQDYISVINNVSNGRWCSCRRNKTETKLKEYLLPLYPDTKSQYKLSSLSKRKYDFYIPSLSLIIEVDGGQHFFQVSSWKSPDITTKIDTLKAIHAINHGISLIRISQEDIWDDTIDWKLQLTNAMKKYDKPQISYISSDPHLYDMHKKLYRYGRIIYDTFVSKENGNKGMAIIMEKLLSCINDDTISIAKNEKLNISDHKLREYGKIDKTLDIPYPGLHMFLVNIMGIDINLIDHPDRVVIIMDKENSLYHLLLESQ